MNRKWIGVVVAVALAALGTWVLVQYVQSAEERALEGQETIEVLVVSETVPAGSPAESLTTMVRTELVPAKVQAPGSVASLVELEGRVAAVDLFPGDQLITTRFVTLEAFEEAAEFVVPDGLVEVTVSLTPDRAVGGALRQGDIVAVFASFEPFELNGSTIDEENPVIIEGGDPDVVQALNDALDEKAKTPNTTHLVIHKVLISNVQVEQLPREATDEEGQQVDVDLAPTGNLLVTLAMEPENAERLIFTAEWGRLWLAAETETAPEGGTRIQTRNSVYEDPVLEAAR